MTTYTITITDPRHLAGIAKQVTAFNGGQGDGNTLTVEQYLGAMLDPQIQEWTERHAPISIPTGDWMQRWTAAEQAAALGLAAQSPDIMSMWVELLKSPTVNLEHPLLVQGVPQLCAALESAGAISSGQAATRAAQIMAY